MLCEKQNKINNGFEKTPRICARRFYSGRVQSTPQILSSFASVMQISSFIIASIAATPKMFLPSLNHGTVPADPQGSRFPLAAAELV